jgi:hypothetical protein
MVEAALKKEKKSKKEKRVEEPALIDLCRSSFSEDEAKKIKKAKKEKRREKEAEEVAEPVVVDSDSDEPKKSKKDKKQKKREMDYAEPVIGEPVKAENENKDKKRKHEEEEPVVAEPEEDAIVSKKKKKSKKEKRDVLEPIDADPVEEEMVPRKDKKSKKEKREVEETHESWDAPQTPAKANKNVSVYTPQGDEQRGDAKYWKRIDEDKWKSKVVGTKFEKISHFDKGGDAWGNEAANILGQVKGKGFVKAMQKLKRASWKGQGTIDAGVNSVQFSDWED